MIIYNVTIKIDLGLHDVWLNWMKEDHIPRIMATGCFTGYKMFRILEENTTDGISYCVQYSANEIADYFNYKANFAEAIGRDLSEFFPGKFHVFRTLLKEV
jgi:Domain of unknown function (DUF4286)